MEMMLVRPQMPTYTALRADSVSALREWLQGLSVVPKAPGVPLLSINTPCGETVEYQTVNDVPTVDTPCPCGRPDHWLLRIVASE